MASLPSRERGLKSFYNILHTPLDVVAPFAGAWIEIVGRCRSSERVRVAPFAGAWIEITSFVFCSAVPVSLPSRERGLKYGIIA